MPAVATQTAGTWPAGRGPLLAGPARAALAEYQAHPAGDLQILSARSTTNDLTAAPGALSSRSRLGRQG